MTVTFQSYGKYSTSNYGVNCMVFTDTDGNSFYFSYQTLVAFFKQGHGLVIRENIWGSTTGKHLNWIDPDKSKRVTADRFKELYQ